MSTIPGQPWPPAEADVIEYVLGAGGIVGDPATLTATIAFCCDYLEGERPDLDFTQGTAPARLVGAVLRMIANYYTRRGATGGALAYGVESVPITYLVDDTVSAFAGIWKYRRPVVG